jgi:2-keto-4-pentenoate hydratase/2-oxohepta-3-ene-1,7-dioic acid hydratase in catechol pathway
MKVVNLRGRLALLVDGGAVDVAEASGGRFDPDPQRAFCCWDDLRAWADSAPTLEPAPCPGDDIWAPVPRPRQVFAIGLNYGDHAAEGGLDPPDAPMVFTKFPASIRGPYGRVTLSRDDVDYEAELVVVIGRRCWKVPEADAWSHVAGLTCGQDLSARELQLAPPEPSQFSLAKSLMGFGPIGPAVVTADEVGNPDDLAISCTLSGERVQEARTSAFIFSVPRLLAYLSNLLPLGPGDLIFTGTPAGVGWARDPRRVIRPGDELVTEIEGLGSMRHEFIAGEPAT